jgi:hypothetical protein
MKLKKNRADYFEKIGISLGLDDRPWSVDDCTLILTKSKPRLVIKEYYRLKNDRSYSNEMSSEWQTAVDHFVTEMLLFKI